MQLDTLFTLSGHTALITGGGTGLGLRFARVLHAAGATVIISGRRETVLRDAAATIAPGGDRVHWVTMDVASAESIESALANLPDSLTIDILINNAGVVAQPALLDLEEQDWDTVMDINLKGAWLTARAVVSRLVAAGREGCVVNIASVLGQASQKGTGPYAASKAGLLHLTRNMALEWARHGVRANALAPGYFMTDLADDFLESENGQRMVKRIPQRRLGQPEDLDGAILLLASPASRYMTGSVITVDGGHSIAVL